jgi:cell division GTPase FtsZ
VSGPVIARIARETGALVLGVAILPFDYEGSLRRSNAAADSMPCVRRPMP